MCAINNFILVLPVFFAASESGPPTNAIPLSIFMITLGPRGCPQAIIDRNEDVALLGECLGLVIHLRFVAAMPATPMNPDGDGMIVPFRRSVDVERLQLILRVGVGEVAMDFRFCRVH